MRLRTRWSSAVAVVTALTLIAGCTKDPDPNPAPDLSSSTPAGDFAPGADGLGDRYYPKAGNGGYDVGDYDLAVTYDPGTKELTGVATITATATASLSRFNLDFTGLDTKSITVNDKAATYDQDDAELVVTPADGIASGSTFTTVVTYGGEPKGYDSPALGSTGFLTTTEGAFVIGEPESASTWFPVNDHPRDKATYTIKITSPTALATIANGVRTAKVAAAREGYTTTTWRVSSPMAPYLATFVIGNYRVQESTYQGKPVILAVHSSLSTSVDTQLARTGEVIDFLQQNFGPYPFDALGGIVINDRRISFALETQTRPVYSSGFFPPGRDGSWVIAHELAHQWFGDSVSINEWNEIWLNEGFATYAEWMWVEAHGGSTVQQEFDRIYALESNPMWTVPPGSVGVDHIFSFPGSEYDRGAMTLHALRRTVGNETFFKIMKAWPAQKKDGVATTAEFVALAEQVSGKDLDPLFNDWLYAPARPPRP